MPGALALTWAMTRSGLPDHAKLALLLEFDGILGLGLAGSVEAWSVPEHVSAAQARRSELRTMRDYPEADAVRRSVGETGTSSKTRPQAHAPGQVCPGEAPGAVAGDLVAA